MPASEAQIAANRANARHSSGPRTPEGKAISRRNSLRHGLTGSGIVLPNEDAAEVERTVVGIQADLGPTDPIGEALAYRVATMAVRMRRCVAQENAALAERVQKAMDDFEPPEGVDAGQADRLRILAGDRALFDPSKEACLARKYEAAASREFFRALKEMRGLRREPVAAPTAAEASAEARASLARLASSLPAECAARPAPSRPAPPLANPPSKPLPAPSRGPSAGWDPFPPAHFDVPIAIGRAR